MKKKGNAILDGIFVVVILFAFALIAPIGYDIFTELNDDIQSDGGISGSTKNISSDLHTRYPSAVDGLFFFAFILIWAFVVVASFMVDTKPYFLVFSIILLAALLFIGAELANAYDDFTNDEYSSIIDKFPKTNFIMQHLFETIAVIAASILIVLFGKNHLMGENY